jgi:ABC-type lipoprotein release transport system permease subunit
MRLPFTYPLRNLLRRPWRTGMTVMGIAVVVFAAVLMLALSQGLFQRLDITGDEHNLLVISRAGQNIMFSSIPPEETVYLLELPGVATGAGGEKLVSPEVMHAAYVGLGSLPEIDREENDTKRPVYIRGVRDTAFDVHRSIRITAGALPEEEFELLAGATAHVKMGIQRKALAVGNQVYFEGTTWTVCGHFEDNGSMIESEMWVRETDLFTVMRRRTHSFITVRFETPQQVEASLQSFRQSGAIEKYFKGWPEKAYYREYTKALSWLYWLSLFMVGAITLAGALIGVNTMYTAIISRLDEIATLRTLGFMRYDVALALLVESVTIAVLGAAVGIGMGMLVDGLPMKVSQGAFFLKVDLPVIGKALVLACVIGIAGALIPLIKGLRMSIIRALRHG